MAVSQKNYSHSEVVSLVHGSRIGHHRNLSTNLKLLCVVTIGTQKQIEDTDHSDIELKEQL
jgi:hypothetical protein